MTHSCSLANQDTRDARVSTHRGTSIIMKRTPYGPTGMMRGWLEVVSGVVQQEAERGGIFRFRLRFGGPCVICATEGGKDKYRARPFEPQPKLFFASMSGGGEEGS